MYRLYVFENQAWHSFANRKHIRNLSFFFCLGPGKVNFDGGIIKQKLIGDG